MRLLSIFINSLLIQVMVSILLAIIGLLFNNYLGYALVIGIGQLFVSLLIIRIVLTGAISFCIKTINQQLSMHNIQNYSNVGLVLLSIFIPFFNSNSVFTEIVSLLIIIITSFIATYFYFHLLKILNF